MTGPNVLRACAIALLLAGCGRASGADSPAGVLTRFVEAMERSGVDSEALKEAYGLLDQSARKALQERAALAQNLSEQAFEPWQMLAQARFRLRFDPTARMHVTLDGDHARVAVRSVDGAHSANVPMVREHGRWRIVLEIPPTRTAGAAPGGSPDGAPER